MIHHSKGFDLEITDFDYNHDLTPSGGIIPSQTMNLKHVENIQVLDKAIYDTSFERP